MDKTSRRKTSRKSRHLRVRKKISGTTQRPRICVFRSARHIYVQAIDDQAGVTLTSTSTCDQQMQSKLKKVYSGNCESAALVGKLMAEKLKEKSIEGVVFDRGGFLYHGRIKALAEALREGGIRF